jgi:acetyl-CoA carboxylase biotin carboxylase subunit
MFDKVLIANRGEIAVRINRACHELGIKTVAVHSTIDSEAMHARLADESVCIGPPPARESYLNIPAIIAAAEITNADAVHPGYGFLAENERFASIVEEHGLTFIGPAPEHIALMGDKVRAKLAMRQAGVPVVPGSEGALADEAEAAAFARETGFPVLLKAVAGGGGRGMKVVRAPDQLAGAFATARAEALAAFGDGSLYVEKLLERPRHIEFQVLADQHGNAVHLGERECSLQRRHQKLLEEAPSPALNLEQRDLVGSRVVRAIRALGYCGVGTIEFLYENGAFYFIEMNTRIQVEHPVTEMITGIDLVREQIRVAAGAPLGYLQDDIRFFGHALECRVNAEHPETFAPCPGEVTGYHAPGGLGVRVDSAIYQGYRVPPHYDSMIAKVIVHGQSRNECIMRMRRALGEYVISGVDTTIPLHLRLLANPDFANGEYDVAWLERLLASER